MIPFDHLSTLVALPPEIDQALCSGFDLAVSISGGKDSDAMAYLLHHMRFRQNRGWGGRFLLLHADLGRAEHRLTPRYIARFAQKMGVALQVLEGRDLVDVMKARRDKLQAQGREVPFWPSARARYCTSDLKRTPISAFLRQWSGKQGRVICAIGLRAEESATRAKKAIYQPRSGVHTQSRLAYDWLPLHDFQLADVWATLGYTLEELHSIQMRSRGLTPEAIFQAEFNAHPAYSLSNNRLSCGLCILASQGDLRNGAYQNPEVYREYVQMEIESGYSFQPQRWLGQVAPELLSSEMRSHFEGQTPSPQPIQSHPPSGLLPQQLPLF